VVAHRGPHRVVEAFAGRYQACYRCPGDELNPTLGETTVYDDFLLVRECRVRVEQPGFRVQTLIIATTLLDTDAFTNDDLATLYRARWHAELDLRSLKETLQMDVLRCKTPALVRKELWTHILAYNLIRMPRLLAEAA